jgi:hypothetical protein
MAWKLIYTSAPRLLQAGRSGFGTVARHREIPPLVAETAEKSSQFSRQTGLDSSRAIFAYRLARSSAGTFHLLTRISDAGTDYSGRTNHLAEHLILSDQEALGLGAQGYTPAGVMLAYEWTGYEGQARWLGDEDLWQPSATDANTGGSHWHAATTDANRVKLLASAEAQSGAVLEYPAHYQSEAHPWVLWLFAESQCLCPQSGWGITFTTNVQPTDSLSDFRWLGVPDNSPVLQKLQGSGRPLFSFATDAPTTFVHTPDVQEPTPISVLEGEVRSVTSTARGAGAAKAVPPPKKPIAVEKRPRTFWLLYTFLAVMVVALVATFWWFLPADAPTPPAPPRPSNLSTQASTEEPSVTSIPPEKAPEPEVKKSTEGEAGKAESKLIGTKKPSDPAIAAPAVSPSQQTPTTTIEPPIRPARTFILFPGDSWERLKWPAAWSSENLQVTVIDRSGKRQTLEAPPKFESGEKFYKTQGKQKVLRASGHKSLPSALVNKDSHVFEISSKHSSGDTWRIYVLPDNKPLQSVVPKNDFLKLDTFVVSGSSSDSFLKSTANEVSLANLLSYIKDESASDKHIGSIEAVLEASYPEPSRMQAARPEMINRETATAVRPVRIPVGDDGRLDTAMAAKPFKELSNTLGRFVNNTPTDILLATRNHLVNSLNKIEEVVSKKKESNSQPPNAVQHLAKVGDEVKPEEMEETLNELIDGYFRGLELLLPNDPPDTDDSKDSHYYKLQAIESVRSNDLKNAKTNANYFMAQKKLVYGADLGSALGAEQFGAALEEFERRKGNVATKTQEDVANSIMEDLKKSVSGLLVTPPNAPDLSYTLKLIIDQAEPGQKSAYTEYIITEGIRVVGADGSKSSPSP